MTHSQPVDTWLVSWLLALNFGALLFTSNARAVMSGRVLCVTVASASGHVIVERFYERLPETTQMQWRRRLHEASSGSLGHGGASTLSGNDFARVEEVCGVSHQGEDCMVWCGVGDIRFYAVGSGQYDELARASRLPPPPVHPPLMIPSPRAGGSAHPRKQPPLLHLWPSHLTRSVPYTTNTNCSGRGSADPGNRDRGDDQETVRRTSRVRALRDDLLSPRRRGGGRARRIHKLGPNPAHGEDETRGGVAGHRVGLGIRYH
jgi:hypothetical protein